MDYKAEVRAVLTDGPVLKWPVLRRRRARFFVAYQHMLAAGEIVESGTGAMGNPIYVGWPGSVFPAPKKKLVHIRKADIKLMARAGHTEVEAREILGALVNDFQAYIRVLAKAEEDADRLTNDRDAKKWEERVTA
jgi:hypothetical protein